MSDVFWEWSLGGTQKKSCWKFELLQPKPKIIVYWVENSIPYLKIVDTKSINPLICVVYSNLLGRSISD
jgi:hypothetical protein